MGWVLLSGNFTGATEGRAVIIDRLPPSLQRFFSAMRGRLSKPQSAHLWGLVLAVAVNLRQAKLVHLSAPTPGGGARPSRGPVPSPSDWDAPAPGQPQALGPPARLEA